MLNARERLEQFLTKRDRRGAADQLTPDASTREYFRVRWNGDTAIACVYPHAFAAGEHSFLDVSNVFMRAGLPVAEILDFDESLGVILQEDLGDRILRDIIVESDEGTREGLINDAIALIPRIQTATVVASELDSVASRSSFDRTKLLWELDFFSTNYFLTYKNEPLQAADEKKLFAEFLELSIELELKATTLCHRDFHAANLMIDMKGRLRIIDHQDARMGSTAYDLVSLLLDRVTEPPTAEWLAGKRSFFLSEREKLGLEKLDERAFADEFRLQAIQRCLKAIGTFSYQSANRGKTYFVPFIRPMFEIVRRAAQSLDRFPAITKTVSDEIDKS